MCVLIQDIKDLVNQYNSLTPLSLLEVSDYFRQNPDVPLKLTVGSKNFSVILDNTVSKVKDTYYIFKDVTLPPKEPTEQTKLSSIKRVVYLQPLKAPKANKITLHKDEYLKTWFITKV